MSVQCPQGALERYPLGGALKYPNNPQPLRNVISGNHPIEIGPRTFARRPKLAAYVAQTIAGWAQIELSLALVLARDTSRNIEQSVDMYLSIDGSGAQSLLLEAAARTVLSQDNFDLFDATMRFTKANHAIRQRNGALDVGVSPLHYPMHW
jgi:hypothetical protein